MLPKQALIKPFPGIENYAWPRQLADGSCDDYSQIARSNDAIFETFISNYNNLDSDSNVFIQWSHAERFAVRLHDRPAVFLKYEKNQLTRNQTPPLDDKDIFNQYNRHLNKTMGYMKAVQEMCAAKDINYRCWTVDNMSNFKDASVLHPIIKRTYDSIDRRLIFNWAEDGSYLETYNTNDAPFIVYWATRTFPICFGLAFGGEVDTDQKHLTNTGHKILADQLREWMANPDLDLEYNLTKVSIAQADVFKDLTAWSNMYHPLFKDSKESKHWVEKDIMNYLETMAKKSSNFIYES